MAEMLMSACPQGGSSGGGYEFVCTLSGGGLMRGVGVGGVWGRLVILCGSGIFSLNTHSSEKTVSDMEAALGKQFT